MKRDRYDRKRGRHKKRVSRETRYWEAELLLPARPPWMPQHVYETLAKMREHA